VFFLKFVKKYLHSLVLFLNFVSRELNKIKKEENKMKLEEINIELIKEVVNKIWSQKAFVDQVLAQKREFSFEVYKLMDYLGYNDKKSPAQIQKIYKRVKANNFQPVTPATNVKPAPAPKQQRSYDMPKPVVNTRYIPMLEEMQQHAISETHKKHFESVIRDLKIGLEPAWNEKAVWYTGAKQYVANFVRNLGGKKYHKSSKDVSGSVYYELPDGKTVRISDHELPETEVRILKRENDLGGWNFEIVLDTIKTKAEINEMLNIQFEDYLK
jgi:hypothetical protein